MADHGFLSRFSISTLLCLLMMESAFLCLRSEIRNASCIERERAAILAFKASLNDPRNILSSWEGENCCGWWGVVCNNETNHITGLNLRSTNADRYNGSRWGDLSGEINPSLLHLKHLRRLDLSLNDFTGTLIPEFIGSLGNLRYLNLSGSGFAGEVPPQIGNLSHLRYLDLRGIYLHFPPYLHVNDLGWLQHLSSLKYLNLGQVNLTAAVDWLEMINMLPSLTFLSLAFSRLPFIPSDLPRVNFTNLNTLRLEENNFNTTFPNWICNISSLTNLDLYASGFYGPIPDAIGNLASLQVLQLGSNGFKGMIPSTIRNLCSLYNLDLSYNEIGGEINELVERLPNCTEKRLKKLNLALNSLSGRLTSGLEQMMGLQDLILTANKLRGPIPEVIGKLSQLIFLDLVSNSFEGVVTEAHFANLTRLRLLILSGNSLTISWDESWVPTFQLKAIGLRFCRVGPRFPAWLRRQKEVSELDLSSTGISGTIPEWFWKNFPPLIQYLDLSNNSIGGKLPESLEFARDSSIMLNSNLFEGTLPPNLPYNSSLLNLSNNSFSGPLPSTESPYLAILDLSNNLFSSSMPSSLGKARNLMYLDFSNNNLSGEIPDEWPTQDLSFINLANNHLSGTIPSSISSLTGLRSLGLSNNSLAGEFPSSLRPCIGLYSLDLSRNKFVGKIPTWMGEDFPFLSVLLLRSNMFAGEIPRQMTQLHYLQILDLAENNLSGPIPQGLSNLTAMSSTILQTAQSDYFTYDNTVSSFSSSFYISSAVFTKGEMREYTKNRYLLRSIDLSDNHLRGEIPEEIGALTGLINLNLSANHLEGEIPDKIGMLHSLESLDLSRNHLSGNIPLSISTLNFLSNLNLSYNNLSGRIPSGNQIQTMNDPSIYAGNVYLCGPPLQKNCLSNRTIESGHFTDEDGNEIVWLYVSMGLGYAVGFSVTCSILVFKKTWRYAYFRSLDNMYDRLYVAVYLFLAKLKNARVVEI